MFRVVENKNISIHIFFLIFILVIVTKTFQNLNHSVKGVGCTVTFEEKLPPRLPQPPYQELLFAGDMAWSHGMLRHQSWVLNLIFTWDLHWLISSSRELACDE